MTTETYLVTRDEIDAMPGRRHQHFLNPNAVRTGKSLGDRAGLTGLGFHIVEIEPGRDSTEYHYHHDEDEAVYVLSGQGRTSIGNETIPVEAGDFIGYRKRGLPHVITNSGDGPLRYIIVGERLSHDAVDYPRKQTRLYVHPGQEPGVVAHAHIGKEGIGTTEPGSDQDGSGAKKNGDIYLITKDDIEAMSGLDKTHFLNANAVRVNKSLGDATGLAGIGFHLIEVEPGRETTEYHVHHHEDECVYILSGEATATIGDKTSPVKAGDFIGYRKGGHAHTIENTGKDTLRCIVVGERLPHDVADYPRLKKRLFRQAGLKPSLVDHDHIEQPTVGAKK
jgi:uncharacterized cupin superfamily protein